MSPVQSSRKESTLKAALGHSHRPTSVRPAILHITSQLDTSAEAHEIVDLAVQTHRASWRPLIASAGGALVLEAERAAVRHTRVPLDRRGWFAAWRTRRKLESLVAKEHPVLVHAHGFAALPFALKLSHAHGIPILADLTEPVPPTKAMQKLLAQLSARQVIFRVPSTYMATFLRQDLKLESEALYQVSPGVDLQWFDPARVTPERLQILSKYWRLPEQATVFLLAAPLVPGAGHKLLLEAMKACGRKDLYAVLVGEDHACPGMRAELERCVSALGLEGHVIMPETCEDWPAACWLASVVVAPNTLPRGQSLQLLAAQALGRPVIASRCGANAEMADPRETAWIVAPDDKTALAAALTEAAQMPPSRRTDLAMITRAFVSEHFTMQLWRDSMFQLYGMLLAPPEGPRPQQHSS